MAVTVTPPDISGVGGCDCCSGTGTCELADPSCSQCDQYGTLDIYVEPYGADLVLTGLLGWDFSYHTLTWSPGSPVYVTYRPDVGLQDCYWWRFGPFFSTPAAANHIIVYYDYPNTRWVLALSTSSGPIGPETWEISWVILNYDCCATDQVCNVTLIGQSGPNHPPDGYQDPLPTQFRFVNCGCPYATGTGAVDTGSVA